MCLIMIIIDWNQFVVVFQLDAGLIKLQPRSCLVQKKSSRIKNSWVAAFTCIRPLFNLSSEDVEGFF